MEDSYRTIEKPAEGDYREKGSRFLAFGFPVENEEEIGIILTGIRKKYHDARHHCYAYRLGSRKDIFRVNDDGEPSGTAGKPIYGQLLSNDLTNVLVVVVRYFGGTLLGTGGLIVAYRSATANMLSHANLVTRHVEVKLNLSFPYEVLNNVMKILKDEALVPENPDYSTRCSMFVKVREGSLKSLVDRFQSIPGLHVESL
jgi:uncharacterized YigZ family protein